MLGILLIIVNILMLLLTYRYYRKYHKLSTTLLLIVLLSLVFKNSALIISDAQKSSEIYKTGMATFVLFAFSILISIIQAGTLSVKYMYLPRIRKIAWGISFFLMILWFFLNQLDILTPNLFINYILNNFIELLIVAIVGMVGFISGRTTNHWKLLYGSLAYFGLLILLYLFGIKSIKSFAISQTFFVILLLVNEIESIKKGKFETEDLRFSHIS